MKRSTPERSGAGRGQDRIKAQKRRRRVIRLRRFSCCLSRSCGLRLGAEIRYSPPRLEDIFLLGEKHFPRERRPVPFSLLAALFAAEGAPFFQRRFLRGHHSRPHRVAGGMAAAKSEREAFFFDRRLSRARQAGRACGIFEKDGSGKKTALHSHRERRAVGSVRNGCRFLNRGHFAYSTTLVSRMRWTLIWPGYSISSSIFLAMSRARMTIWSSETCSGLIITRTSRPA